jgi:molybdopterin converting factor small subunit
MKVVILPGFSELIIKIDPLKKITRDGLIFSGMPWLFAPWPEAKSTGIIEIDVAGNTLKDLLKTLALHYQKAGVDFEPIKADTNDVDYDYNILVNGKNYAYLPQKLETKLKSDDEVKIKLLWRWDG